MKISHRTEQRVTLEIDVPAYVAHKIGNALFQSGQVELGREILDHLGLSQEGSLYSPAINEHYPALEQPDAPQD